MLSPDLMEIIRCPKCRGELAEITAPEGLTCQACRLFYPIIDGIPNLLIEEARPYSGDRDGPSAAAR